MNQSNRHSHSASLTIAGALLALLLANAVAAQEIYKTINKDGSVEYTTIPPTNGSAVQTLTPGAEPTEAEVQAAQEELQRLRDSLEERSRLREESAPSEAEDGTDDGPRLDQPAVNPLPGLAPFL